MKKLVRIILVIFVAICVIFTFAEFCIGVRGKSSPAIKNRSVADSAPAGMVIVEEVAPKAAQAVCETEQPEQTEETEAPTTPVEEPELVSLGTFKVTHYCPCAKCCGKSDGITATGTVATPGRTLAVDPSVIPYGSIVVLRYEDGTEEDYIAEDCGGAINGNKVDVFMGTHRAALYAGVRTAEVLVKCEK